MVSPNFLPFQRQGREQNTLHSQLLVCFLTVCSTVLLFKSYRLESFRLEALASNSATKISNSRTLPEEDHNQEMAGGKVGSRWNSELYVPSLDFRIKGVSQYSSSTPRTESFAAHIYCKEFEKDLLWEWWQPAVDKEQQQQESKKRRNLRQGDKITPTNEISYRPGTTRKRLLIGVSGGYNNVAKLLERSVWSARVYGALWSGNSRGSSTSQSVEDLRGMDVTVVTLQGTAFSPHGCKAPLSHSSIDKIRLLFEAIDARQQYDRLLLLDSDAMIYDMQKDLTALLDDKVDFVVAGPPILTEEGKKDKYMPWKIASGMTLWNLEHPSTPSVALDWFHYAKNAIILETYQNDQKYLHKALQKYYKTNRDGLVTRRDNRNGIVHSFMDHQFDDDVQGTVIKQFGVTKTSTGAAENIHDKQVEARLSRMQETAQMICKRFPDVCNQVGAPPHYETS